MSERAAHRLLAGVEHPRDLSGPEAEHVAQDQDGPLTRRQQLQGSHERQRDGLARLDAGTGTRRGVRDPLEERIGVGSSHITSLVAFGSG